MKTLTITIISILFMGIKFHANAWNTIVSGTNNTLYDICFTDADNGYAVGSLGTILKTTDGGQNWNVQSSGTTLSLYAVYFVNSNVGYVVGGNITTSVILKTSDGGANWTAQTSPINKWLRSVYFTDPDTGYIVGNTGTILKTTDGGLNWQLLNSGVTSHLYSCCFINSNVGFIAGTGAGGKILKTTDAGLTWIEEILGVPSYLNRIFFVDNVTGFICSNSNILKTVDSGSTWTNISNLPFNGISSIFFTNATIGYVSCYGNIYKTIDGGLSWSPQATGSDNNVNDIFFTSNNIGYAVGTQGTILKTNIGGGYIDFGYMSASNINARFNHCGSMFWDLMNWPAFEVPKGSGHMSLFAGTLWIGGKDNSGQIHLAGDRYSALGHDYFPGPIMDSAYYSQDLELWNRMWKITRTEIENHIQNWSATGYVVPSAISEWPGNGDTNKGQSHNIAPYVDVNGDGLYTPQQGDYPLIKGDEALFFVFNDQMKPHTETTGLKLGAEIRAMAYAFNCPGDSAIWNTLFLNYEIVNRSQNTYDSSFVGTFMDLDVGDASDDYIGCDVSRGTFYGYNGDTHDGDGQGVTYGLHPPAQSVTFLGGPYMDADGSDYGSSGIPDGCDESINGMGFNDGNIDNERLGMSSFMYFNNSGSVMGDPQTAVEYYNYLNAHWKDGTPMTYGGNGHLSDSIYCKFMFPDVTDSCGWGTEGIPLPAWNEVTASNSPDDRRGVGAMGPFTMLPGSVHNVDIAFVFGRDFSDPSPWAGVVNMQQRIDSVRKYFNQGQTPCGSFSFGVKENKLKSQKVDLYPNPANIYFDIKTENIGLSNYKIYTLDGVLVKEGSFLENQTRIYTEQLTNGLYIVDICSKESHILKKIVIIK